MRTGTLHDMQDDEGYRFTYRGALYADHGNRRRLMWSCNHKHRHVSGAKRCAKNQLGLMEHMVDHFLKRLRRR